MIQLFDVNEFKHYSEKLPEQFKKMSLQVEREMAMSLATRIRMRAPLSGHSTHSLKNDIKAIQAKTGWKIVGPGHARYVNRGVAPDKFIPVELFEQHQASPGSTAGVSAESFLGGIKPKRYVYAGFHGGKGFITRAEKTFEADVGIIIERGIIKALTK